MASRIPTPIAVLILVVVVVIVGFFGYRALVPPKVLLAPGTKIPPMPPAPAARVQPPR
jgi:hypothetical protein